MVAFNSAVVSLSLAVSAAALPQLPIRPRWFTCEVDPLGQPPRVETPLHTIQSLGTYSPFVSQASPFCRNVPDGFIVDQVTVLSRHGARSPTASALKKIQASVDKLANITSVGDAALEFVKTYSTKGFQADQLTDFGKRQLYDSGVAFKSRYSHLANKTFTRASGQDRVIESGQYFLQGFNGLDFSIEDDVDLPQVDVVISEEGGLNNTLSVTNCPTYNKLSSDPEEEAQDNWLGIYGPPIAARLDQLLPGANTSKSDVLNYMSLCGFDAVRDLDYSKSDWCPVFTSEEWDQNEYYFDVEKWYGHGPGSLYAGAQYSGYVNELLARLTNTAVTAGGSVNSTLDDDAATFPLDKTFYADFTHDNDMLSILATLGVFPGDDLATKLPANASLPLSRYPVSKTVPFAGHFVFERLASPDGTPYIRILINDAVVALPWAGCGAYGYDGVCALDVFVAAQTLATSHPKQFDDLCYAAQLNKTIV